MEVVSRGFWLGGMVLEVLGYAWFVSLPLLLFAAATWMAVKKESAGSFRAGWIALAVEGGATMLILILGAACARAREEAASSWAGGAVGLLVLFGVVAGVAMVVLSRGNRWLAAGTASLGAWIALVASFVASMSISGDWI